VLAIVTGVPGVMRAASQSMLAVARPTDALAAIALAVNTKVDSDARTMSAARNALRPVCAGGRR